MNEGNEQTYRQLLQDCLAAVTGPLTSFSRTISNECQLIRQTFDANLGGQMSVIEEEQTDRQTDEHISQIRSKFNTQVRQLVDGKKHFEDIVNFYKSQMQEMARQLVKKTNQVHKLAQEKAQNKRKKSVTGLSPAIDKKTHSPNSNLETILEKKEEEEQLRARPAPSPFQEHTPCTNCPSLALRVQTLEQQRGNWKALSAKIDDCKRKMAAYELELKAKETEMEGLREKLVESGRREKCDRDEEEKKRLKKDNTTLRGQKVLLGNQLAALRRQLAEKTALGQAQQAEVRRLRLEVDNLNSSLNRHTTSLSELREGVAKGRNHQSKQYQIRLQELERVNILLLRSLEDQQLTLNQYNEQVKRLEQGWSKKKSDKDKKIAELEAMVEDKNETIVRLKTGKGGPSSNNTNGSAGYQADMVRVLNKRLAEREERIRVLEQTLADRSGF